MFCTAVCYFLQLRSNRRRPHARSTCVSSSQGLPQCLQHCITRRKRQHYTLSPDSAQGWNCFFIISITFGLRKRGKERLLRCEIEEVVFLLLLLMICSLMDCFSPDSKNQSSTTLVRPFPLVRRAEMMNGRYYCVESLLGDTWALHGLQKEPNK